MKILIVANRGFAIKSSRELLIDSLLKKGVTVIIATSDDEYSRALESKGVIFEPVNFNRGGVNILGDILSFLTLFRIYRKHLPNIVHHFHAKPVIMGSIASKFVLSRKIRVVNTITGLGHAFISGGFTRHLAGLGYRLALGCSNYTIFQNGDDRKLFISNSWIVEEKTRLIVSSGVDAVKFSPQKKVQTSCSEVKVLMVGRLIRQKGVYEFTEAAAIVKKKYPHVKFSLIGEKDFAHPDAISEQDLQKIEAAKVVSYIGYRDNLNTILPKIDIFVLPSYREGVPRVVLEASACGIPSIGADVVGTREAIENNVTGYLTAPKDVEALAKAIIELVENSSKREEMGRNARAMIEDRFDIIDITKKYVDVYDEISAEK